MVGRTPTALLAGEVGVLAYRSKKRLQNRLPKSLAFPAIGSPPSEARSEVEQAQRLSLLHPSHLQRQSTLTSLSVGNWKRATLIGTRRIPVPTGIKEEAPIHGLRVWRWIYTQYFP
ncbi:hypothetical protein N657DRAFT_606548 [Parathielavia appendiculata]|uniref:Uncharacterized protein n=1 Tax=Parathielavia appendiculata TaxID=2587402 RepID=A0AAN6YXW7_9PEZI|nr:hypothetical protein N657DRAFT_606548 [Parathielavia appendiculata]